MIETTTAPRRERPCVLCGAEREAHDDSKCSFGWTPPAPTRVVNLRLARYDFYIGRAGHGHDGYFGNPFALRSEKDRGAVLDRYRQHFLERVQTDAEFRRRVLALRGKTLGCFCKPKDCHGDVIAAWVDAQAEVRP